MTDDAPGSHLDDLTLSDLIDGLAGPEAEAHAAGCSECAARVAAWRAAAGLVAEAPGPAPANVREGAIGVALAARSARSRHLGRLLSPRVAAAAAAVVLVGAGAFGISVAVGSHARFGTESKSDSIGPSSTNAGASAEPAAGGGAGTGGTSSSAGSASESAPSPAGSLGRFDSLGALAATLKLRLAPAGAAAGLQPETGPQAACRSESMRAAQARGRVASGALPTFSAPITYRGHPSWVYVFGSGQSRVAVVANAAGCTTEGEISF